MALDRKVFDQTFNRLAVALRETKTDVATKEVYFRALEEFPAKHVSEAALMLAQQPDRRFFPTTGEWVSAVLTVRANENRDLMALPERTEPWYFECQDCEDTGWIHSECDGLKDFGPLAPCGRKKPHYPHSYVTICSCRATNRTYMRHHAHA